MNKLLAFTLTGLLLLGAAGAANAQDGSDDGIEIKQVKVLDLRYLDENVVRAALTIKEGDVLVGNVTAKLNAAADSLKQSGWFSTTPQLSLDSTPGGAQLIVKVDENPRYHATTIEGNTLFDDARLLQEIDGTVGPDGEVTGAKMVPGEVINVKKLVTAIKGILSVYDAAGYVAAAVEGYDFALADDPNAGVHEGDVTVRISEGKVDEVIIAGLEENESTQNLAYNQVTHLKPDTILTRQALERDINQLYNTGLFDTVTPDLQPSLKEGYAKVVLNVTQARTGQVGFGLGYSTLNGIQGSVNVSEKNLFGTGKAIDGSITMSDRKPSFNINYTDRYYSDNSFWSLGLYSVHSRQQRYPGTAFESKLNVDSKGVNLSYGQKMNDYDSWQVGFGLADYDYSIVQGDPFRGYSPRQRARLSAKGETRKLTTALTHDTRDNVFQSTEGVYTQLAAEFAGFGGDFSFNKWAAEGREFYPVAPSTTLALRQRLIISTGNVPIYEETQYGGVQSVRGLPEDQIFGTKSFLSNVELRRKINDDVSIAAFLDSAWAGETFSDMDNATGIGIGPRFKLKFLGNQPIRLDYGIPLSGADNGHGRFHFYFGEMF